MTTFSYIAHSYRNKFGERLSYSEFCPAVLAFPAAYFLDTQAITALQALLEAPKRVVITTHHKPDADALGSSLALAAYLRKLGHTATVVTPTDYPEFLNWMSGQSDVVIFQPRRNEKEVK